MRILLIEHDTDLIEKVKPEMDKHFVVDVIHNGYDGTFLSQVNDYAAIVIESSLPDETGSSVCRKTRNAGINSPVVLLSDTFTTDSIVETIAAGADILLPKSIDTQILMTTIKTLITRRLNMNCYKDLLFLEVHDLTLDIEKKLAIRKGEQIILRRKEYCILELLLLKKNKVVLRNQILEHIWEEGCAISSNTLDVHIKMLRDKIDRPYKKKLIKTVHGLGYTIQA